MFRRKTLTPKLHHRGGHAGLLCRQEGVCNGGRVEYDDEEIVVRKR